MSTDTALTTPAAARPLGTPMNILPFEDDGAVAAAAAPQIRLWKGWQGDLRFFATAYAAGFVFFLAILS